LEEAAWADAWNTSSLCVNPARANRFVAKTFPLAEAAEALRYLVEDRPFGEVVLTI